jgi:hypothetical protein
MLENAPAGRSAAAPRAPTSRSAVTNQPRKMVVSANTPLGRRLRDLADHLAGSLGGWSQLTDLQASAVRKAAELTALAEDARARKLNGATDVTLDDLVRLDRLAEQSVRRLGLDRKREPAAPDLRAQFRAAYGLRAGEELEAEAAIPLTPLRQVAEAGTDSVIDHATAQPAPRAPGGEEAGP